MNKSVKIIGVAGLFLLGACGKEKSPVTGWNYSDAANGGYETYPYEGQETGPGLVFVEGGTFTMGRLQDDVMSDWNNVPHRVTVSSFYMDETEVTNTDYREYLYWTARVFGPNYPQIYTKALPDTLVWRSKLAFMEDMVRYYLRHPSYQDYPVVGINWLQASDFCKWRTDRVNEYILVREGVIDWNGSPSDADYFNTEEYLAGKWAGKTKVPLPDYNPSDGKNNAGRNVKIEDGIFLPDYRLPTEAEWEFAATALIGNTQDELISQRRIYPWNGHATRNPDEKYIGQELANFKKAAGDYMGVSGDLNDAADITSPVFSYWPNDYGLYGMAGNVSEWVMDVYRPMMSYDGDELRPFRGNEFTTQVRDQDGIVIEDSIKYDADSNIINIPGEVKHRPVDIQHKVDNLAFRRNYHESDEINYLDGDPNSTEDNGKWNAALGAPNDKMLMYQTGSTTLISDITRIYKGGSWKDLAFWMSPGARRYLDERQATDYIGFRCAMSRLGNPVGLAKSGGRY